MSTKPNYIGWTPVKLARSDGEWSLEVQRLISLSRTLYRPQHGRIHGREPILEELRDREALAADVEAVFSRVKEDGVFELRGGRFRAVDPDEKPLEVVTYDAELEARVKSLEGELKRLQAKLTKLSERGPEPVQRAKSTPDVAEAAAPKDQDPAPQPEATPSSASAPPAEETPPAEAAAPSDPTDEPEPAVADHAEESAENQASGEAEPEASLNEEASQVDSTPAQDENVETTKPISLPGLEEFSAIFDELVGGEVTLSLPDGDTEKNKKRKKATKKTRSELHLDPDAYVTLLLTDDDNVVGAMACSQKAIVYEGGSLLMLGPEAIEAMLEAEPTEEAIEAAHEIFNVASRCFNEVAGNPHVRVTTLKPREPDGEHAWIAKPRDWVEFVDSKGGQIWLLAK